MIVDDFKSQRSVLKLHLGEIGANVIEAVNGKEALTILKTSKVDLVFTDFEMPELNGIEMAYEIKKNETLKSIPIIMISSAKSSMKSAFNAGISHWLDKPFNKSDVVECVDKYLKVKNQSKYFKVLLIDDFKPQLSMWKTTLQMKDFEFIGVNSAREGLEIVRQQQLNAILTDYVMPDVDGLRFARKIKSMSEYKHIPIFLISGNSSVNGVDHFGTVEKVFLKSTNPDLVKSELRRVVGL